MRATPLSSKQVLPLANTANAAVKGRIAVPALPKNNLLEGKCV